MLAPCPFPTHQGTQVLIRHLACSLSRAGHEVHFITYGYGEYEHEFPFHLHRAPRVDAGLRSGPNIMKPAADAAMMLTASRVAKAYKCDLIHAHNVEGLGLGALLKLQIGLPLVYHAHNAMGPELPTYFNAHLAQAFAGLLGDVLDRTLPRAADAVVTFDPDHKSLHEVYGVDEDRIHVIPPGLDGNEISGAEPEITSSLRDQIGDGPLLLYAGNPDGYQNLPLMWRAFAQVRAAMPNVRLLCATGHDPSAFSRQLEEAGSPAGVIMHRYRSLEELRGLFALADIGLSPRTIWTGAPIKILNYLAAGLRVVACRSAARHILSSTCGVLVEDDAEAFAAGILNVLEEPRVDKVKCRRAFERFSIDSHVPLYEGVYRQVLGSRLRPDS
jgi:glycosyltransferase involved in cell wall biosynthesis